MKVLQILSHPDYNNPNRTTNQLASYANDVLTQKFGADVSIETLNLYDPAVTIPRVNQALLTINPANGLNEEQLAVITAKTNILNQFKAADLVIMYTPLHNFNVTSQMKDYFDNILAANETFKYTENGPVGLLSDKTKKVAFVLTSGSVFTEDFRYIVMDIAPQYVRAAFNQMGIQNVKVIRVQGLDIWGNDRVAITNNAKQELKAYIESL